VMTEFEDDVRAMLHRRAADATTSPDAWEEIQTRLQADERPAVLRQRRFQVVAGGAAAAAVAALVVGQVLPGSPATQVADQTPTTVPAVARPDHPWVWPADPADAGTDPVETAADYVEARTGVRPTGGEHADHAVLFLSGPAMSEVFVVEVDGRWFVDSSTSDLVPIFDVTYDEGEVVGGATAESSGTVAVTVESSDRLLAERWDGEVGFRDAVPIRTTMPGFRYVVVRVVLTADDGTVAISERWVPATETLQGPTDGEDAATFPGIWPVTSGDELASLEDSGDAEPWMADPAEVALAFLEGEVLGAGGDVTATVGTFMQGDATSGEVPFELSDGGRGLVLVRRASAQATIWFVTFATTDGAPFDLRTEDGGITVESRPDVGTFSIEVAPLPAGPARSASADDTGIARVDGVTDGIVTVRGATSDGGVAFTVSRVAAAG
jgi:hypothetical protein